LLIVSKLFLLAAINHYIEAGATEKAVNSAIESRQFKKAIVILEGQDPSISNKYYHQIGMLYSKQGDHEVRNLRTVSFSDY